MAPRRQPSPLADAAQSSQQPTEPFYAPPGDDLAAQQREYAAAVEQGAAAVEAGVSFDATLAPDEPEETLEQKIARIRASRAPLGSFQQKLAYAKRPGYQRHWFNDAPGRVNEAMQNGWALVYGVDRKPVSRSVGTGRDNKPLLAFLMEIPEVIWQEDMAERHKQASERVDQLKRTPFQSGSGAAEAKPADRGKFYDPGRLDTGPVDIRKGA